MAYASEDTPTQERQKGLEMVWGDLVLEMTRRTVAPLGGRAYVAKKVENDARQNGQYCEPGVNNRDTEVLI